MSSRAQILQESSGMIHLSFDLWTSSNYMSIMAVVAHYCDNAHINRTRLIALRRLRGSHSGENIAELLASVPDALPASASCYASGLASEGAIEAGPQECVPGHLY
jgi:hypothetical protein